MAILPYTNPCRDGFFPETSVDKGFYVIKTESERTIVEFDGVDFYHGGDVINSAESIKFIAKISLGFDDSETVSDEIFHHSV